VTTTVRTDKEAVANPPARVRVHAARFVARHPEWWVVAMALCAWSVLLAPLVSSALHAGPARQGKAGMPGMVGMPGMQTAAGAAGLRPPGVAALLVGGARAWVLMVLAMMLPVLVPRVRRAASRCVGKVRNRAVAQTLAGTLLVWCWVGAVVVAVGAVVPALSARRQPFAFIAVWLAAALWQLTPVKRRALRSCHRVRVPGGAAEGWARVRAGTAHAMWCAASCGPAMAAMAFTGHSLVSMVVLSIGLTAERVAHRADRTAHRLAAVLAGSAMLSVAAAAA
jgi:hypothetical protein